MPPAGTGRETASDLLRPVAQDVFLDLAGRGHRQVAEDDAGRIVGSCGIYALEPGVCELRKMYVLPSARGHGLGKKFLERALARARALGYRRIELDTASCLKEAIGLYRKYGFRDIVKPGIPARCDTAMALELA